MTDGHTSPVTPSDVEDFFVQICPARSNRSLLVSGFSSNIETQIRQRLHSYVTDDRLRIRYCPWQSGTSTLERHWEAEPDFPSDLYSQPDVDTYRTVLTHVLRTFLRQPRNFSPAVTRLMDNKVPLRSDAQARIFWTQSGPLRMYGMVFWLIPSSGILFARTPVLLLTKACPNASPRNRL